LTGKKPITVDRQLVLADGKDDNDDIKVCSGYECMTDNNEEHLHKPPETKSKFEFTP
jgi:hypothetical protein